MARGGGEIKGQKKTVQILCGVGGTCYENNRTRFATIEPRHVAAARSKGKNVQILCGVGGTCYEHNRTRFATIEPWHVAAARSKGKNVQILCDVDAVTARPEVPTLMTSPGVYTYFLSASNFSKVQMLIEDPNMIATLKETYYVLRTCRLLLTEIF